MMIKNQKILKTLAAAAFALALIPMTSSAAAISWSGSNITGDSNVSTNGTLVFAIRGFADDVAASTIVNSVAFVHSTRAGLAAATLAQSGSVSMTTTLGNDNSNAFGNAGLGAISTLTQSGYWGTTSGNSATVDFTGLAIGQVYEIQFFTNDARTSRANNYEMTVSDGTVGGATTLLQLNNSPDNTNTGANEAGDYAIGIFTANLATQSFEVAGLLNGAANAGRTQINGIQLRAIPEPGSMGLAVLGGMGLLRRRRAA